MNSLLLVLGTMLTLFGLWQLDWAFWVDKVNAFNEYWHGYDLGWTYLGMMLSIPFVIVFTTLGWPETFGPAMVLFFACQIALINSNKSAPLNLKILWWKFRGKDIGFTVPYWILLNDVYVFAGAALVLLSHFL